MFDKVDSLGFAQRQIIEFCRAYISDAKIVILDEPSSALTRGEIEVLLDIVRGLKAKGVACVPGSAFGEPRAMRISYTCPTPQLAPGLERIQQFFAELA